MKGRRAFAIAMSALVATAIFFALGRGDSSSVVASAKAADVACVADPLGPAPEWTVVVHGDLIQSNTDSEGRVAVGGDATLTNFGVASNLPDDGSRVDLAVGGDLKATNVGVNHGSITYGGRLEGNATAPKGTISQSPLALDALYQEGERRSRAWAELEPNGDISGPEHGALSLTGEDPQLNVFRIDAARLEGAQRILLRAPFGSSVLVNVLGASYTTASYPTVSFELWDGSGYVQFGDGAPSAELETLRRSTLWNFPEASSVQIGPQLAWQGSVLAPDAAFAFPANTQLNGTIVVGSMRGDGESHLHPPDRICLPDPGTDPPSPPEPPPATIKPKISTKPAKPKPGPSEPSEPGTPAPGPPGPGPSGPGTPGTGPSGPGPAVPSFDAPSEEAASLPGPRRRTHFKVVKQVLDREGRPVELLRTRPGQLVRFRLFGYNLGFVGARGVVACDDVPPGLEFTRAGRSGPHHYIAPDGSVCWRLGTVDTQREAIVTFRVRDDVCGRVVNRLEVRTTNGGDESAAAQLSACRREPPDQTG